MDMSADQTELVRDDESNYSIKRTRNGITRYYLDNVFVKIADVPDDVKNRLEFILHGWSDKYAQSLPSDRVATLCLSHPTNTREYSYHDVGTCVQYYRNGVRVPKRCIPPWEFQGMRDLAAEWRERFRAYSSSRNTRPEPEKTRDETESEKTKDEPRPPKMDQNVSTYVNARKLLESVGITDQKTWKAWLLKNHPDKNPAVDLDLVQLVNGAIDLVCPE